MTDQIISPGPGIAPIAERLLQARSGDAPLIVGLTGSVAVGKTTLAGHIASHIDGALTVEMVSTDGFLFPNAVLEERGQTQRKGFPETYDRAALSTAIEAVRTGEAVFPAYSHITFDIDMEAAQRLTRPDILIVEGLGFQPPSMPPRPAGEPDVLVYIDAELAHIEDWFLQRFVRFWEAAEHDPTSFYAQFRHMTRDQLEAFAMSVWASINLPNLENHILPLREAADLVITKGEGHGVMLTADRL